MKKSLVAVVLSGVVLGGCSFSGGSADIMKDPVTEAAMSSKEGKQASLLIDTGNRFVECLETYNDLVLSDIGQALSSEEIAGAKQCTISLESHIEEGARDELKEVVFTRVYNPECEKIPNKEDMLRVEVDQTDYTTIAEWQEVTIAPSEEDAKTLQEALPKSTCEAFVQTLFALEPTDE